MTSSPFTYQQTKSGLVMISTNNRVVTTLKGKQAINFLQKVEALPSEGQQLLMAKATGQFKFANKKLNKGSDQ